MNCDHVHIGTVMIKLDLTVPEVIYQLITDEEAEAYMEKRGIRQDQNTVICSWCVIEDRVYGGK